MREKNKSNNGGNDMIKNIQSLMDKSKNFAKNNGLSVQEVLQNYMFERFLERLSKSEYNEKFIIKGRIFIIFYNGN
jgi:hypothetical protein